MIFYHYILWHYTLGFMGYCLSIIIKMVGTPPLTTPQIVPNQGSSPLYFYSWFRGSNTFVPYDYEVGPSGQRSGPEPMELQKNFSHWRYIRQMFFKKGVR